MLMTHNLDKRPGYINGQPIIGYDEVTLHHIADLLADVWGGHKPGPGRHWKHPVQRNYRGPKGKWRKWKRKDLYGEPHWYIQKITETGRRVVTVEPPGKEQENGREYIDFHDGG
jgi:hypothetical protein